MTTATTTDLDTCPPLTDCPEDFEIVVDDWDYLSFEYQETFWEE